MSEFTLPDSLTLCEVGTREGFQSQPAVIPTDLKIRIINKLLDAGFTKINVAALVNPKLMPQMADADEVMSRINCKAGVTYSVLVLNEKGLERAIKAKEAAMCLNQLIFVMASTISVLNLTGIKGSFKEVMERTKGMIARAKRANFTTQAFVSASFGCSIEGPVDESRVIALGHELCDAGADDIVFSDTTGQANPVQIYRFFTRVKEEFEGVGITAHFHDVRGAGLANILALLLMGLERLTVDVAFGGLGGDVPFVPGAGGNVATEDLVCMLEGMGVSTGIDLDKVIECSKMAEGVYGQVCPSHVLRAGPVNG